MKRSRRAFLIGSAIVGGGFAVGYWLHQPGPNPLLRNRTAGQHPFNAYVKIDEDNVVTVAVPRAEMGQGVQTALAILVADELDVDLKGIRIEHPVPSKHYINKQLLGDGLWFVQPQDHGLFTEGLRRGAGFLSGYFEIMQLTGGSSSVRDAWIPLRTAGATARAMLIGAAADLWQVDAARLTTDQGNVVDTASNRVIAYGQLAARAQAVALAGVTPQPRGNYRLIGKPAMRLDTAEKVNGKATFGIDFNQGTMLYAAVRSVPTLSGSIASYDELTARKGVERVVRVDDRTVAVVADSYWTARRALDDLALTFKDQDTSLSSDAIFADFARRVANEHGHVFRNDGDAQAQLMPPRKIIEAEYHAPYLAHACMEPLNCTARFMEGNCEVWLGTQAPGLVKFAVARALDLRRDAVIVNATFLGGGFGRRLEADIAVQGARIAREFPGKTVKLIWSREEDMCRDVFRPAAMAKILGAVDSDGMPDALFARICSQSVMKGFLKRNLGAPFPFPDKTNAEGLFDQPYAIPHYRVEHIEADHAVPVGNWRGVGHGFNGFVMETFLDELGRASNRDPFEVRRHLLRDFSAKIAILDRLQTISEWKRGKPAGVAGRGMAYRQNFGSDVAQVVDIAVEENRVKVKRVFCVIDCGQAIDPRGIESQVESGIIYGLSAALMQAITIKDGQVQQANFHQFDALRIYQCPEIEVEILQNNKEIGGVGETAVPPVAPALANAVFDATGRRICELPLSSSMGVA